MCQGSHTIQQKRKNTIATGEICQEYKLDSGLANTVFPLRDSGLAEGCNSLIAYEFGKHEASLRQHWSHLHGKQIKM